MILGTKAYDFDGVDLLSDPNSPRNPINSQSELFFPGDGECKGTRPQ